MKKRIISAILALMITSQPAYASILGSIITGWEHDIANGTSFYQNTFMSEQSGVGQQVEYYAEYTPNENVVPAVISGQSLWGLKTIKQAEQYMKDNDMVPLIGINASFFSFKTGIPMGHVLSDGRIMSKDTLEYPSIGFKDSGEAFIAPLAIETTLTSNEKVIDIAHINKYNQTIMDIINLYTTDFDDNTHTEAAALYLIIGEIEGNLGIGDTLNAVVEEKFNYTGSIKIPSDKMVLVINETGRPDLYNTLNSINIGDPVTISSKSATDSELWNTAVSGLGSEGATLVKDGVVQSGFQAGAAPRTAVGITETGNVIFYVIDGRQPSYSYGVQTKTLANRMKELGCVDAINLDGGGSTAISGIYPGTDENTILNSPSEGTLRACSNYIFLKNAQKPTGELGHLYLYPFEQHYLSGYSEAIFPAAADTAYYKMNVPENLSYSISGANSIIDSQTGIVTAMGDGEFTVSVTDGNITGSAKYKSYSTPTNINVYNADTNNEITSLQLQNGDTVKLSMAAQYNYTELKTAGSCFDFEVTNNLGYVDENNILNITAYNGNGVLKVIAGEYAKEIPISIHSDVTFIDTVNHWAYDMINSVYEKGIINGYETESGVYFKPDNNMTREEFAVIVCKFLNLMPEEYADFDISGFADNSIISDWAKPYVAAVYANQLITGKTDGDLINFAPKDTLTRAEAMTILGRTLDINENEVVFADSDSIPVWAAPYVGAMVSAGIVNGYEDNTIRPNGYVTRAEAVTIINKMLKINM